MFCPASVKMRPYWIGHALNPMIGIFVRREDTQAMEPRIASIPEAKKRQVRNLS